MRLEVARLGVGRGSGFGEGVKRAGSQREQDGRDTFLDTTETSIKQQDRKVFCALNLTRSRYKQTFMCVVGCRSMPLWKCLGGKNLVLAVGSGKVKVGSGSVWKERMKRAGPQRERDGGDSFLATTGSIR